MIQVLNKNTVESLKKKKVKDIVAYMNCLRIRTYNNWKDRSTNGNDVRSYVRQATLNNYFLERLKSDFIHKLVRTYRTVPSHCTIWYNMLEYPVYRCKILSSFVRTWNSGCFLYLSLMACSISVSLYVGNVS